MALDQPNKTEPVTPTGLVIEDIIKYAKLEPLNINVLRTMLEQLGAMSPNDYNAKLPEAAFEVDAENWGSDQFYIIRDVDDEWVLVAPSLEADPKDGTYA